MLFRVSARPVDEVAWQALERIPDGGTAQGSVDS
jgi:hypothetical protein